MGYDLLADIVVITHAAFVLFAMFGGFLVLKWKGIAILHIPAAIWGTLVELAGWVCPLTYLENWLRDLGRSEGYQIDFIDQYLLPVLYPPGLTRTTQIGLGSLLVGFNLCIYWWVWRHSKTVQSS